MNSDLTQTDNVISTRNPQNSTGTVTGSEVGDFQPTATQEVLTQNRTVKVVSTGQPVETTSLKSDSSSNLLIIAVFIAIAGAVFLALWLRRNKAVTPESVEPIVKTKAPVKKKKLPRSKRNKGR